MKSLFLWTTQQGGIVSMVKSQRWTKLSSLWKTLKKTHRVRLFQGNLQENFGSFLPAIKMERHPALSLRNLCFKVMAVAFCPPTALTGPQDYTGLADWQLPLGSTQLSLSGTRHLAWVCQLAGASHCQGSKKIERSVAGYSYPIMTVLLSWEERHTHFAMLLHKR